MNMAAVLHGDFLTHGAVGRDVCASLAISADRTLFISPGEATVTVVPLGAVKALSGTSVVHVCS